jgi:ferredoxin
MAAAWRPPRRSSSWADGIALVLLETVDGDAVKAARKAVFSCPEGAIVLEP